MLPAQLAHSLFIGGCKLCLQRWAEIRVSDLGTSYAFSCGKNHAYRGGPSYAFIIGHKLGFLRYQAPIFIQRWVQLRLMYRGGPNYAFIGGHKYGEEEW